MMLLQTPRGTRDFAPEQLRKRQYVLDLLRRVFESYAYDPLETPAMEMKQILLGKYGEEGDKLIFKILDNGELSQKIPAGTQPEQIPNLISEKALRYDLTIPMARFIAMHANSLPMPFKRYQMQTVWRGDKPQKGRYREFCQCDVDIVGSDSLLCEAELLAIYDQVFSELKIPQIQIQLNSRRILQALIAQIDATEHAPALIATIDKLEKIGQPAVLALCQNYLDAEALQTLEDFLNIHGENAQILNQLMRLFAHNPLGQQGIAELKQILALLQPMQLKHSPKITPRLARGIDYYTGMIVEVVSTSLSFGSLGGGGRYQDIASSFGVAGINGVGISFGLDRICDVLASLNLFPTSEERTPSLLFAYLEEQTLALSLKLMHSLRQQGLACMLYPEQKKLSKQFKYAEKKGIPYLVFIGSEEAQVAQATVKHIHSGKQSSIRLAASVAEWRDCLQKLL